MQGRRHGLGSLRGVQDLDLAERPHMHQVGGFMT